MKVFFEFSRSGTKEYLRAFEITRTFIIDNNHKLTRDLLAKYKADIQHSIPSKKIFGEINKAISDADCVIIEGSTISLAVSYVLTQSIMLSKPVLFLTHSNSPNLNLTRFVNVINSKLLTVGKYDKFSQIPKLMSDFFKKTKYIKTRFNLVLPNDINSFVTSESKKRKKSKTEYIISLIQRERKAKS